MSENLDLVRSIHANWNTNDYSSVEWAHPKIEFVVADGPDPGACVGLDPMAKRWREQLRPFEDFRFEAEQYREIDSERVLVLGHFRGRGKTSGMDLAKTRTEPTSLFHLRAGRVTRLVLYWDRDRALADLGLEE